ncbi:beta-N-acetylhexosaminidase [Streptomyces sp. NBC_01236]|uniref:beta-N-acetylhexosaminidase n=1 Tax=Streptomyces sp. NBC_01236 TaxID=2903789 RepID=UPI002E137884|nr:beta-N-acetylhexosaminidase [Streptomyces sp. NBC_01236]
MPAADVSLLPAPGRLVVLPGRFTFDGRTTVTPAPGAEAAVALLRELLAPATGLPLPTAADGQIAFTLDPTLTALGREGYGLRVTPDVVHLHAADPTGLLRGVQTLRQLLPPAALADNPVRGVAWTLPCVLITDAPRHAWRGAMLDVARHFQPASYIRRFIDLLALHKLNTLHLHLTDDQGWRMPVAAYPKLTEIGARRAETAGDGIPHGGSYTRADLRGLVAHAAARGVTVVPEIDMPGHVRAALAAYPELGNDPDRRLDVWTQWGVSEHVLGVHDRALDFCRTVLDEVMDTFPSPYLHVGGDECPTTEWAAHPDARRRAREEGLAGPERLHGWFMGQIGEFLVRRGRRPLGWCEDGVTLPRSFTVLPWRDAADGLAAARRGHQVVMAPHRSTYFDYRESGRRGEPPAQPGPPIGLDTVHAFRPAPADWEPEAAAQVLGTQAQLWTEYLPTPAHIEYRAFPRLCALAENAWSAPRPWPDFTHRLWHHRVRLHALGVTLHPPHREPRLPALREETHP